VRLEGLGKLKISSAIEIRSRTLPACSIELVNKVLARIWKKAAWSNIGYYPGLYLEELRRKTEILCKDGRSQGGGMKPIPPNMKKDFNQTTEKCSVCPLGI
jgi:hypothetical protein